MKYNTHLIRKSVRILIKCLLGIVVLSCGYLLAAVVLSIIPVSAEKGEEAEIAIYIMNNGVHTDIVMPIQTEHIDWKQVFITEEEKDLSSFSYIAVGWGNKDFYLNTPTWGELKPGIAVSAATGMGDSLFHIIWLRGISVNEQTRKIFISAAQYQRLIAYIYKYLKTDEEGRLLPVDSNIYYGVNDYFYEAKGHYSLFFTCNTWANQGLKAAGLKACLWTPFQQGIFYQYRDK